MLIAKIQIVTCNEIGPENVFHCQCLAFRDANQLCIRAAVANLWHACPKWHVRRFYVAHHVFEIYQKIMTELHIFESLQ